MGQEANNCPRGKDSWFKIRIDGPSRRSGDLNAGVVFKYSRVVLILSFLKLSCLCLSLFFSSSTLNFRKCKSEDAVLGSGLPCAIFRKQLEEKMSSGLFCCKCPSSPSTVNVNARSADVPALRATRERWVRTAEGRPS